MEGPKAPSDSDMRRREAPDFAPDTEGKVCEGAPSQAPGIFFAIFVHICTFWCFWASFFVGEILLPSVFIGGMIAAPRPLGMDANIYLFREAVVSIQIYFGGAMEGPKAPSAARSREASERRGKGM